MGCHGSQSFVVLLSIFNLLSLVFSAGLLFISAAVSIGICKGKFEVAHIFTYNAHVINELMKQTNMLGHGLNLSVGVGLCIAAASFTIFTAIYGFIQMCCRCKGTLKAAKAYTAFVTISALFHVVIIIAAAVIMTKKVPGSVAPALAKIQSEIRVYPVDDINTLALNSRGALFQDIQSQFGCCGVNSAYEWPEVEWFREKYGFAMMLTEKKMTFPCSPFAEILPLLRPCSRNAQPDCTTAEPMLPNGCAAPVEDNMRKSLHGFICMFSVLCINQVIGLILAAVYTGRMQRRVNAALASSRLTSASRLSCVSTTMLVPQYPTGDLASMDEDQLAQMCFEIIAKNQSSK